MLKGNFTKLFNSKQTVQDEVKKIMKTLNDENDKKAFKKLSDVISKIDKKLTGTKVKDFHPKSTINIENITTDKITINKPVTPTRYRKKINFR